MTIELLLSMHQGQGTSSSTHSPASGSPRAAPGVFFEALTQAVTQQSRLPTSVQAGGVPTDVLSAVTEQLASLDIELDAEALESIRENMHENGRERAPENVRDSVKAPRQAVDQAPTAGMQDNHAWHEASGTSRPVSAGTFTSSQTQDMGLERSSQPLPPPEQTASSDTSKGAETTPLNAAIAEVASRLALIASYSVAPAAQGNETASAAPVSAPSQGATTTGQTSLDSRLSADNVSSSPASFLARTTLPMSARLLDNTGNSAGNSTGNSTENSNETTASTPVSRQPVKAQDPSVQPQSFSISQTPTPAPNSSSTSAALPLATNNSSVTLQENAVNTTPRDVQPALTGERVAEASQLTTQAPANTPSRDSAPVAPPLPTDSSAVARQEILASAAPRDGQPTLTSERVTAASKPTAQTPPLNTPAPQPTPQAPTAPSRDSAPIAPPLPADGTTVARQETLASAAPRDGQPTLTSERVTAASQPTAQTPPLNTQAPQPTPQAPAAPNRDSALVAP
ncbi:hypothetical protein GPL32_06040, partial [Halomonas alkaliphila]|nr:hypothetical protein [Halomonas alkaliphila]